MVCVAIARKAPRLMEWCRREFKDIDSSKLEIITEIALPFMRDDKRRAAVIDEAIYHGTTFSKVMDVASVTIGREPEAWPAAFTVEAILNMWRRTMLRSSRLITDEEVPLYVNTIISRFLTLGKPYDIEHPLLYTTLPGGDRLLGQLLDNLAEHEAWRWGIGKEEITRYATETYSREDGRYYTSHTMLCDYMFNGSPRGFAPLFAKLRFFTNGDRLCVAAMSPYVISEKALVADSTLFSGSYREVWNTIVSSVGENCQHRTRSLIVMANYLLSLSLFESVAPSLRAALSDVGAGSRELEFSLEDLQYLVGARLAKRLLPQLHALRGTVNTLAARVPTPIDNGSYIPLAYRDDYEAAICRDILSTARFDVEPMLSGLVSAMHREVEIRSRKSANQDGSRLHFGETFRSLTQRMRPTAWLTERETLLRLHKGIDRRIDIGTLVPNYLKHNTMSRPYWTRAFRSGENEDPDRDQPLRLLMAITRNYLDTADYVVFQPEELELVLAKIVCEEQQRGDGRMLFGHRLSIEGEPGDRHTCLEINGERRPLTKWAREVGLLERRTEDLLRISSFVTLGRGAVWTKEEETAVGEITREVGEFSKRHSVADMRRDIDKLANIAKRNTL